MQATRDVLLIRPAAFGANAQTFASNAFQRRTELHASAVIDAARIEFEALATALTREGVRVHVFEDSSDPVKPDAVFPNNWVTFHHDGTIVLHPLLAPSRRLERRFDVLAQLVERGFRLSRFIDLTHLERSQRYLEGTGSLVFDHPSRTAFACLSPRTHPQALREFGAALEYEIIQFEACDRAETPLYHTNVMMSLGTKFAVVCVESIRPDQRARVCRAIESRDHEIVELSMAQMECFAANILELDTLRTERIVAMSTAARDAMSPDQLTALERIGGRVVAVPIPTIESVGGGSVRCMIAEVHLPRAD
jgi:hypothetical protein